jgi:hypothetical protein
MKIIKYLLRFTKYYSDKKIFGGKNENIKQ